MPNLICIHPFLKMFLLKKFSRICCLLFSYQCSLLSFATAYLDYHIFCCLSTTFLILFFALSLQVHSLDVLFATAKIEYHVFYLLSTTFLMFSSLIFFRCIVLHQTEKEGFEPSRRSPDLHPQQGRLFSLLSISPSTE